MTFSDRAVSCEDSVLNAAKRMVEWRFGAIAVVDEDGTALGVLREGDVMRLLAQDRDLGATTIKSVGLNEIVVGHDATLASAREAMYANNLSLLPVTEDGRLIGFLTPLELEAHDLLLSELGPRRLDVITEISPDDEMFIGQMGTYLIGGASALRSIKQAMAAADKHDLESILDLPSGFGRVLRVLKAAFPDARLTASDIQRKGVDFCAQTFGARPVYAPFDPAETYLGERFDLIWVGSLFTHLDRDRWLALFDLLVDSLVPGGLLVFTTFGRLGHQRLRIMNMEDDQIEKMLADYDSEGFGYQGFSGDPDWGMTINSPNWVRGRIAERPVLRLVSYVEQGWRPPTPGQDVIACIREELR